MYIEAWSEITLDSTFKRLCNSYTMACPPEHVLPSRESARMPAEVYMLTQVKHDLVYPACLLGQLLLLRPARPWAKASQSLLIFPAKHDRARRPAHLPTLPTARPRANASQSLPNSWTKHHFKTTGDIDRFNTAHPGSPRLSTVPPRLLNLILYVPSTIFQL